MAKKSKVININNMPSSFRGTRTRDGKFIQTGVPPVGGVYDKVSKTTGLVRLGNEFLYNGINSIIPRNTRDQILDNTVGEAIRYINTPKSQVPSDDDLGPSFPFNIFTTPTTNGRELPQKQYAAGGKVPNVVNGGIAKPLGNNLFYMAGRKHSQGGIDIGPNDKTGIEVEDGEVIETNGNELKVYSAQPILNGNSPAQLVMGGANPNKVFNAQENYKDRNRINDDGSKYKKGGKVYNPPDGYKRQIAESGSIIIGGYPTIAGNRTYGYVKGLTRASKIGRSATNLINLGRQKIYDFANKIDNSWINQGVKEVYRTTIGKNGSNIPRTIDYIDNNLNINKDKKAMGGLSRDKDYGSKKKPYPNVAKKDFAGSHRSYPIPTKADARDALRLAGLHGRNDVKAKVYRKYPELRKKGAAGLIVSINGNVKNGLLHTSSSTGGRHDKLIGGGRRKGGVYYYNEDIPSYISDYEVDAITRASGRSLGNYVNNIVQNTKVPIDTGNRRPQYYAERNIGLFNDGAGITSGLVRPGWSHGTNRNNIGNVNVNIPSLPPRRGSTANKARLKTSPKANNTKTNTTTSIKQPPKVTYNRNLPKVTANIPTKINVGTSTKRNDTSDGRVQGRFKNLTTADLIGLGSNLVGSVGSYFATKRAINNMQGPNKPTSVGATKLKTKHNINPQLDRIREDKFEAYRDIDSNTASSRVGLARKQRVRNAAGQAVNQLYGNKENIETELINRDRLNQQGVRMTNAQQYNQYLDRQMAFNNGINEARMSNVNNLFTGINAGIQDMIGRYENRKALNNTIGAMRASAPNVDDRIMRDAGVDYDEFTIRKRRKLGGR